MSELNMLYKSRLNAINLDWILFRPYLNTIKENIEYYLNLNWYWFERYLSPDRILRCSTTSKPYWVFNDTWIDFIKHREVDKVFNAYPGLPKSILQLIENIVPGQGPQIFDDEKLENSQF